MAESFSLGGVVAGLRETTSNDAHHPATILVVDVGGQLARISMTEIVCPASHELLQIGQFVGVRGVTDSHPFIHGSTQLATEICLPAETYH